MDLFDNRNWSILLEPLLFSYKGKGHPLHYKNSYQLIVMVISLTRFRCLRGIFSITPIIVSALVPAIIATIVPFLPLPDLLVKIV